MGQQYEGRHREVAMPGERWTEWAGFTIDGKHLRESMTLFSVPPTFNPLCPIQPPATANTKTS